MVKKEEYSIQDDLDALKEAGLPTKKKRRYTKKYQKRTNGICGYPDCTNKVEGRSTYCEEHKKVVKTEQTMKGKKRQILEGELDKSAGLDADTWALYKSIRDDLVKPEECQALISKRKQDLKYLDGEKQVAIKDKDWDRVKELNKKITSLRTQIAILNRGYHKKKREVGWNPFYDKV